MYFFKRSWVKVVFTTMTANCDNISLQSITALWRGHFHKGKGPAVKCIFFISHFPGCWLTFVQRGKEKNVLCNMGPLKQLFQVKAIKSYSCFSVSIGKSQNVPAGSDRNTWAWQWNSSLVFRSPEGNSLFFVCASWYWQEKEQNSYENTQLPHNHWTTKKSHWSI